MKGIKTEQIKYMGYHQGWKVWVNGKKYPKQHGHWYTYGSKHEKKAIEKAIEESKL